MTINSHRIRHTTAATSKRRDFSVWYYRLLLAIYVLQGGFRDFYGLEKSYIMVFRWSRYSLFSVVLCFFFITVYPHVCMCTEMFQSATLTQCGWYSFLYYAWKYNSHWVKWDKPNNNSRQTIENTHWDNCFCSPLFLFQRNQGILFKCCGCLSPISCLYYLIIRSFYDELNIEMNFTISLWWGDDSSVYLAIQFVVMQLFCYFYVSTWIKKNITSPPCFFPVGYVTHLLTPCSIWVTLSLVTNIL